MRLRQRSDTAGEADGEILRTDMCSRHLVGDRLHRGQGILDAVIEFPDQKLLQFFRAFAFPDVTCHLGCAEIGRASCRERVYKTCRSRWSRYHYKKKRLSNTPPYCNCRLVTNTS